MRTCPALAILQENALKQFLAQFADSIHGALGCFDPLRFKGYLPGKHGTLARQPGPLAQGFQRLRDHSVRPPQSHAQQLANQAGLYQYLSRLIRKDDQTRQIAERDGRTEGLIGVFAIREQAQSFQLRYGEGRPRLVSTQPRCLCPYCYYLDRDFGLLAPPPPNLVSLHRPDLCQRHSWREHQLTRRGLGFTACDNAFTALADPARTQQVADKLHGLNWPRRLAVLARRVNSLLADLLAGMTDYWVTD